MSALRTLAVGVVLSAWTDATAQQSAPEPEQPANAATVYRRAIAAVKLALRLDSDDPIDLDFELAASELPVPEAYSAEPWPECIANTAVARTLFAQATQIRPCRFDAVVESPLGELTASIHDLGRLHMLVIADAWQRLGGDPTATLQAADQLLDHALHVGTDLATVALPVQLDLEQKAAELLQAAAGRLRGDQAKAPLERALSQLELHLAARPDRAGVADRLHASARSLIDYAFEEQARRAPGEAMQGLLRETKALVIADFAAVVAPLRSDAPPDPELVDACFAALETRWKQACEGLDVERALRSGLAKPLAAAICLLYAPDAPEIYRLHLRSTALLEASRTELLERLGRQR